MADLTQLLYILPFIFNGNLLPSSTSPHSLNFAHPILALAVTAASQPPLAFKRSPKYQKLFTVSTSSHNLSTGSASPLAVLLHRPQTKFSAKLLVTLFTFAQRP